MIAERTRSRIEVVEDIATRYGITALAPLVSSCHEAIGAETISVAALGRFKAGKSSLLNSLVDRDIFPVGVVPVTAVVTELAAGLRDRAEVRYIDGRSEEIDVSAIASFVSEQGNPENAKGVKGLRIEVPELGRWTGLRIVDTPGLGSVFVHNTETALEWLPNVGLALIAISVDQPLSEGDLALIRETARYTPRVVVVLTKVDQLDATQRKEVVAYVRERLGKEAGPTCEVYEHSTRPGYELLRTKLERCVIEVTIDEFHSRRAAVVERKLETLVGECRAYLELALAAAETTDEERDQVRAIVTKERQAIEEVRAELRVVGRNASAQTRTEIARRFDPYRDAIADRLRRELVKRLPEWSTSLVSMVEGLERWLGEQLARELGDVSEAERVLIAKRIQGVERHARRTLQAFRDLLGERVERAYGVRLRTTEVEIAVRTPGPPHVRVGKIFDRNWELLSAVLPARIVLPLVRRHFQKLLPWMVEKNLSRLATQWTERVVDAINTLERVARERLEEMMTTVERLTEHSSTRTGEIRAALTELSSRGEAHHGS